MVITKIQTETTWDVETETGESYTVIQTEDANFESGYYSWEIWDENFKLLNDPVLENEIISLIINNND